MSCVRTSGLIGSVPGVPASHPGFPPSQDSGAPAPAPRRSGLDPDAVKIEVREYIANWVRESNLEARTGEQYDRVRSCHRRSPRHADRESDAKINE